MGPVDGTENPLEFTKYGTVIQWIYGTIDIRKEYTINGDKITFEGRRSAKVVITQEKSETYLEIYNNTDYSGSYKKTK